MLVDASTKVFLVKSIGYYAKRLLEKNDITHGICEHVFDKTVYLKIDDDLILLSVYPWRAPFTINIQNTDESFSFKHYVYPLEKAFLSSSVILTRKLTILLKGSEIYYGLSLPKNPYIDKKSLHTKLDFLINSVGLLSSGLRDTTTPYLHGKICKYLEESSLLSEEAVKSLIGLGEGFTPSGDDLYVGLVSALVYTEKFVHEGHEKYSSLLSKLKPILLMKIKQTTWASGMYIKYALEGFLDEALENLLYSFYFSELDELYTNVLHLIRRGHESGVYLALGATIGLAYIHEISNHSWKSKLCSLLTV